MPLLGVASYDPAEVASKATTAALAMTALDTANLRVKFVAPPTGRVLVRLKGQTGGATSFPRILLGILEGATVKGRINPIGVLILATATTIMAQEGIFTVSGLTPGTEYTWDAAYGVEFGVAASGIKYGGPNDNTAGNAWGSFSFEVWNDAEQLGAVFYDPAVAVSASTGVAIAMTALDTTNLRLRFSAPATGRVFWRIGGQTHGAIGAPQLLVGLLEGATVKARTAPIWGPPMNSTAKAGVSFEATGIVTGLTGGNEYTWDAAYGVETVLAESGIKYGGPNDATENNAHGGIAFELWKA